MNYQISLFKNTGFNTQNIPGTQALIDSCPQITLSSDDAQCDILQARGLTSLPLRVSYDDAKLVDYIRLSNASEKVYYAVEVVPEKSSPDVTTFTLTYNPIISNFSSVSQLKFLDGVFERHHVSTDNLFEHVEEDPMLVPSEPLEIVFDDAIGDTPTSGATNTDSVVIEASYDVYKLGTATPASTAYLTQNQESVIVPDIPKLPSTGGYAEMYDPEVSNDHITKNPAICYYDGEDADIKEGLARARALGIESGILNQYILPGFYGTATPEQTNKTCFVKGKNANQVLTNTDMQWQYGGTVHNKRIYAGKANTYGLICTASGNKVEFLPEDIHHESALSLMPVVTWTADPRPNGKPYFRYKWYKDSDTNFWMNCISGLPWQNAPLVYSSKSGSELDTVKYQTSQFISDENFRMQTENVKVNTQNETLRNLMGVWGAASGVGNSYAMNQGGTASDMMNRNSSKMGALGTLVGIGVDTLTGFKSDMNTLDHLNRSHINDLVKEAQEFYISQRIVAPQINFPRSESLRDFKGNCCVPYRFKYSTKDLAKMDKILTMYGYQDHQVAPGNEAFLTNRPRFNYAKIAGASIAGTLPIWEREAIADIFRIGVRIWHTLPNTAYYTDGSNDLT